MQYMLIHTGAPDLAGAWDDEAWAALRSWLDETIGSGVSIAGNPLRLDADATTVKVRDGQLIVTDGPYAETKEQVAGFDVIECASLDEAVRWAGRHPHSWMGAVEVRALAGGAPARHLPEPSAGTTRYLMLVCTDPAVDRTVCARCSPRPRLDFALARTGVPSWLTNIWSVRRGSVHLGRFRSSSEWTSRKAGSRELPPDGGAIFTHCRIS